VPPTRSTDPVTALLGQVWQDALDPGYAARSRTRSDRSVGTPEGPVPRGHRRRRRTVGAGISLALVGLLLAAAAVQARADRPAAAERRTGLLAQVAEQGNRYDRITLDVTRLRAQIDQLETDSLDSSAAGARLADALRSLGLVAGTVAATGPGIRIVLDDAAANSDAATSDPAGGRVLDRDLQAVVNGLWAAGAEAVAINGQRLTSLAAIRSAGDAILVDYRPLARPYQVVAIGNPQQLPARFAAGPGGRTLRTLQDVYGIRYEIQPVEQLGVPAAGSVRLRLSRPEGEQP